MNVLKLIPALASMALAGCSMSGLDAKNKFACKAPDGVLCESMSGIYSNAQQNNLPGQQVGWGAKKTLSPAKVTGQGALTRPVYSGTPIRSAPLVLRVWFAPWEDTDGDLHDQSYVYLPINNGKWLIEHNRRRIQDAYRPVRAPAAAQAGVGAGAVQGQIKVTPPGASEDFGPPAAPQTTADVLNGMLRPGMAGSPAQSSETE